MLSALDALRCHLRARPSAWLPRGRPSRSGRRGQSDLCVTLVRIQSVFLEQLALRVARSREARPAAVVAPPEGLVESVRAGCRWVGPIRTRGRPSDGRDPMSRDRRRHVNRSQRSMPPARVERFRRVTATRTSSNGPSVTSTSMVVPRSSRDSGVVPSAVSVVTEPRAASGLLLPRIHATAWRPRVSGEPSRPTPIGGTATSRYRPHGPSSAGGPSTPSFCSSFQLRTFSGETSQTTMANGVGRVIPG